MKKNILIILLAAFIASASIATGTDSFGAGKSPDAKKKNKPAKLVIVVEDKGRYDLDKEKAAIPGKVRIEYGDLVVTGTNLQYDNKTRVATLDGDPRVSLAYGKDISAKAGRLYLDLNERYADISGGCEVEKDDKFENITFNVKAVRFDFNAGQMSSADGVSLKYIPKKKKEKKREEKKNGDGPREKKGKGGAGGFLDVGMPKVNPDEIRMTTGAFVYDFEARVISASAPINVEFEEGGLKAAGIEVDLVKKIVYLNGGLDGGASGAHVKADSAVLEYGAQNLTLEGRVTIDKKENNMRCAADKMFINFKEGEHGFKMDGGQCFMMKPEKHKKGEGK